MRDIPDPGYSGDRGTAPAEVTAALSAYAADPDRLRAQTLGVLQHARLLVPVVAVLGEVEYDEQGLAHDKSSDMAAVLMRGRSGQMALLAFTGQEALTAWNPDARPVPVSAAQAARAARQEQAAALVIDIAGPVRFVVDGDDLGSLAQGWTLVEVSGSHAWARGPTPDP